jgi:hypothetical protein
MPLAIQPGFPLFAHASRMNLIELPEAAVWDKVVNFRNHFVSISTWLTFAGVMPAGFQAFAVGAPLGAV